MLILEEINTSQDIEKRQFMRLLERAAKIAYST
jgi:hypothetical protein